MPKTISFTTRTGLEVSFTVTGKRKRARRPANAYAKYVQRHIKAFLAQGKTAPQAMRAVAKKYKSRRK